MNTKNRKLPRCLAAVMTALVLIVGAYETTAMASDIGLVNTADLLDIHADADMASEVVGQVIDEGHVVIMEKTTGWVKIQAGEIIGWVPAENLIETEISHEEAAQANEEMFAEILEDAQDEQQEAQEYVQAYAQAASVDEAAEEMAIEDSEEAEAEALGQAQAEAEALAKAQAEAEALAKAQAEALAKAQAEALAKAQAEAEALGQAQAEAEALAKAQAEAEALAKAQEEAEALAKAQEEAEAAAQALAQQEAVKQQILAATGTTEEELKLLASIIYCEAKGEPYVGKVAVGSVVLNRVAHPKQPNTISDVIYARNQFTPVRNGMLKKALDGNKADASCYQAALEALAGAKPVGDKIFFRRVNGRAGQVIGRHVFY